MARLIEIVLLISQIFQNIYTYYQAVLKKNNKQKKASLIMVSNRLECLMFIIKNKKISVAKKTEKMFY